MKFLFISTLYAAPWAGSEELWAGAALYLAQRGHEVVAAVQSWPDKPNQWLNLTSCGVQLDLRPTQLGLSARVGRRLVPSKWAGAIGRPHIEAQTRRLLKFTKYDVVVICEAAAWPPLGLLRVVSGEGVRFSMISQGNSEEYWPSEADAIEYGRLLRRAASLYFVAEENRALSESQIGFQLSNSHILRNPIKFALKAPLSWPQATGSKFRMASVARLYPQQKGQDKLLRVLGLPHWRERDWLLSLAGEGPHEGALRRLAALLGIEDRVDFLGQVDVQRLWKSHHLHVLASRYEGMSLAILEAAACGRPSLTTRIADNDKLVADGLTGFLAAASEVKALDAALNRAWELRGELQSMGIRAFDAVVQAESAAAAEHELGASLEVIAAGPG